MKTGWKILFAHNDKELPHIVGMGLSGHGYLGRNFEILQAHSVASAKAALLQQKDLALFIIEAHMAFSHGNHTLPDLLKETLQDPPPRVIIITDSPQKKPDWALLDFCGVDCFLPKEDLFSSGLFQVVRTAVKTYHDLTVQGSRKTTTRNPEKESMSSSTFVASLAHDLKTPLNTILSVADLIIGTELSDDQYDLIKILNIESNTINNLVNQILDYARLEDKTLKIEHAPFNLNELMEGITDSLSLKALQQGLEFNLLINNNVPSDLTGDPLRLRQIIVNLAENSFKFTREGEVLIKIELIKETESESELLFAVMDTGIGIQNEKQGSVFENYVQVHNEASQITGGTGLGTAIAKRLCELMGGEMGVISKSDLGTIFWFRVQFPTRHNFGPWENNHILPENLNILVVSDHPTSRNIFSEYLDSKNFKLFFASTAHEAMDFLHAPPPPFDLVIVDTNLKNTNVFELSQTLRSNEKGKTIPIIVLTAKGRKGDGDRCKKIGINAYLHKPFTCNGLLGVLSKLFEKQTTATDTVKKLVTPRSVIENGNKKERILLVEKNTDVRSVIHRHLTGSGFRVDETASGEQAIDLFRQHQYSLLFLDLQIKRPDGNDIVRTIRESAQRSLDKNREKQIERSEKRIPIIGMTSYSSKDFYRNCLDAGMDDVLIKPLSRNELFRITDRWMDVRGKQSECKRENDELNGGAEETRNTIDSEEEEEESDPIDYQKMLDRYQGKKNFLNRSITGFLNKGRDSMELIKGAFIQGKIENIAQNAYYLRGGATNIKAKRFLKALTPLEDAVRTGDAEAFTPALAALQNEFDSIEQFAREQGIEEL